jgi:hypothetical protein
MLTLSLPLLMFALSGCSEEPPPPALTPQPPTAKRAKVEQAPEQEVVAPSAPEVLKLADLPESLPAPGSELKGLDKVRSLTAARQYSEAVPQILELLTASEVDPKTWLLLRWTLPDPESAASIVDELDAAQALAGNPSQHFSTRAELAIRAGRNKDATAAAARLMEENRELGSVAMGWAVLHGAKHPDPRSLDAVSPEDALVLAARKPASKRADLLQTASTLESWQAKVLLTALSPTALLTIQAAENVPETPEAQLALATALVQRSDLPRAEIAPFLVAGARAAESLGLGSQSLSLGQAAIDALLHAHDAPGAVALAQELMQGRLTVGDGTGGAMLSRSAVDAALRAGDLRAALDLARLGERMGELAQEKPAWEEAAWGLARAARAARDSAELSRAIPLLEGEQRSAAAAMFATLNGRRPETLSLPKDLPWSEAAQLSLHAAEAERAAGNSPVEAFRAAVAAADLDGAADLRLRVRLEWAEVTASQAALTSLMELGAELELPGVQAEAAARQLLAGQSSILPEGLDASWACLADPTLPLAEGAVAALAEARSLVEKKDSVGAAAAYRALYAALPTSNQGPWRRLSVQDGHHPGNADQHAASLLALGNAAVPGLLALHDFERDQRAVDAAFALGDDPSDSLSPKDALALHQAHATLQAHTLNWLLGGSKPTLAQETTDRLHNKALETSAFSRALPIAQPSMETLKEALGRTALLSVRVGDGSAEVLAMSGDLMSAHRINDPAKLTQQAKDLRTHLAAGRTAEAIDSGNSLRVTLLDAPSKTLAGKGRYLLLVDGVLAAISPQVFPESQEGLRYLADIRTITLAASAGQALLPQGAAPERYEPEFLGISAQDPKEIRDSDGNLLSTEVVQISHRFDKDMRIVLQGNAVTSADFDQNAGGSRFIHLVPESVGDKGNLFFGDQVLSLAQIRALDLSAVSVVLSTTLEPALASRWVQAFRACGVRSIVVRTWDVPAADRSKFFFSAYEGLIQHGDPNRSFQQTRKSLMDQQALLGEEGPRWWGPYLTFGRP